ncbi:MAG: alpha/beta hydrolase [Pseudomonadota bacterium]
MPAVEHLAGHVSSGNYRLAVHQWRQAQATANLFLVHGYYDHTGLFGKLLGWALENGCNVVMFDLPGHGLSSGEPAVINDFSDYGLAISDVLSRVHWPNLPLWCMGQSTGCSALIEFARLGTWPFAATVLLAPLIRPVGWTSIALAYSVLRHFTPSVARKFSVNSSDKDFLAFVQREPLQCHRAPLQWVGALRNWLADLEVKDLRVGPALIVQGDEDGTVDWRHNLGVVEQLFPGSRVEYVAGAGHQLANESEELRQRYLREVRQYLASQGIELAASTPPQS